mmetsp:Transcript_708/g.2182  ORF Transcript_708/g.2182 Transcript_708/m.2182 type:complete len:841 (+) Transcript_708:127-2649(+)
MKTSSSNLSDVASSAGPEGSVPRCDDAAESPRVSREMVSLVLAREVERSLAFGRYENAVWLGERLLAERPNWPRAVHLLSTALFRAGRVRQASHLLVSRCPLLLSSTAIDPTWSAQDRRIAELNRELLARCYMSLAEYERAERTLCGTHNSKPYFHTADSYFLLGDTARALSQTKRAIECYREAIRLDPFLWIAYERLCALGDDVDPTLLFRQSSLGDLPLPLLSLQASSAMPSSSGVAESMNGVSFSSDSTTCISSSSSVASSLYEMPSSAAISSSSASSSSEATAYTPMGPPSSQHTQPLVHAQPYQSAQLQSRGVNLFSAQPSAAFSRPTLFTPFRPIALDSSTPITPFSSGVSSLQSTFSASLQTPGATSSEPTLGLQTPVADPLHLATPSPISSSSPPRAIRAPRKPRKGSGTKAPPKKGSRTSRLLFATTPSESAASNSVPPQPTELETTPVQPATLQEADAATPGLPTGRTATQSTEQPEEAVQLLPESDSKEQSAAVAAAIALLVRFGNAVRHVEQHRYKKALASLQAIPTQHRESGWVLHQFARAYFGLLELNQAKTCFERIRTLEPDRVDGMSMFSTILWLLHKEKQLSHLAHELGEKFKKSPETWCVVGNCFSLMREHDTALKFFRRALQLDNRFTYAYTLSGHEYVAKEDVDQALICFRNALYADPRHYNAWYGLGLIYFRQQKYALAQYHFERALKVNPQSAVLHCYLGMVLHANGEDEKALERLEYAVAIDKKNALARLKQAAVLASLERFEESLQVLDQLREESPKEPSIYYMMGCVHEKLGRRASALIYLNTALDLDSKNATHIKTVIEKLGEDTTIKSFELPN